MTQHSTTHTSTLLVEGPTSIAMLLELALVNYARSLDGIQRRRIRDDAGLSRAWVARSIGVTESCVRQWEAGLRTPGGSAALRYGQLLVALRSDHTGRCPVCGRSDSNG